MPIGGWFLRDSGYIAQSLPTGPSSPTGIYTSNLVLYVDASISKSYPSTGTNLWYDLSGNNNHMTLYNCTGNGINAIVFNGVSSYTLSPNLLSIFTSASFNQTQEIWFNNINSAGTSFTNGILIDELGQAAINTSWHDSQLEIVGGQGRIRVWNEFKPSGIPLRMFTGPAWTHVAWRYNAQSGTLDGFVNGIKTSGTGFGYFRINPNPGYYCSLGATDSTNLGDGGYYSGLVGMYRTYNAVIPDDIIYQNYLYESTRFLNSYNGWTPGTVVQITGGLGPIPYSSSNIGAATNWPTWQLFYANQTMSFSKIRQYTDTNGSNSWSYYYALSRSGAGSSFSGSTGVFIGAQSSTSYTPGGFTTTTLTNTVTIPAGYYFLVGCVNGPYYKVFNTGPVAYAFQQTGTTKYTMFKKSYYITHGSGSTTMEIPTALDGTRSFNNVNGIWCIALDGIT